MMALLLALAMLAGLLLYVKRSAPYRMAWEELRGHPAVAHALGAPVEAGWIVSGGLGRDGVTLAFPVAGPAGEGTALARAEKRGGAWRMTFLAVELESDRRRLVLRIE